MRDLEAPRILSAQWKEREVAPVEPPSPGPSERWRNVQEELSRHLADPRLGPPRYLEALLDEALRVRATDIHFEGSGTAAGEESRAHVRIRVRIDGQLHAVGELHGADARHVLSRVKVLSGLDLGRAKFQEGRLLYDPHNPNLEIRVTAVPTQDGEYIALRLLSRDLLIRSLDEIGLGEEDRARLDGILDGECGLILVTGPAGSGKTTTVHAILRQGRFAGRNVVTIEDPVEARLEGATQIDLRGSRAETFGRALMSVLRLDPDVIFLGEIRDAEAARQAVYAATTGKFVFSTVHLREAPDVVDGLGLKGVHSYDIASTLKAVLSQRLIRKICPCCSAPYVPDEADLRLFARHQIELPHGRLSRGGGCGACFGTGYLGRTGVFQLLAVDAELRAAIHEGMGAATLNEIALSRGMTSLLVAALRKATAGVTTLEEVLGLNLV